jgi:hypothetical protein
MEAGMARSRKEAEEILARAKRKFQEELRCQKVRLKGSDVEMELGAVDIAFGELKALQYETPRRFETLVAILKPRGATDLPKRVSPKSVAWLKKEGFLRPDGSPNEAYAAVLDAAYVESAGGEGVVLRDPVVNPSREFAVDRERADIQQTRNAAQGLADRIRENRRKRRGLDGEGPSR